MATDSGLSGLSIAPYGVLLVTLPSGDVGDLYAEIQIVIPKQFDDESAELVRRLDSRLRMYPRADLHW